MFAISIGNVPLPVLDWLPLYWSSSSWARVDQEQPSSPADAVLSLHPKRELPLDPHSPFPQRSMDTSLCAERGGQMHSYAGAHPEITVDSKNLFVIAILNEECADYLFTHCLLTNKLRINL